LGAANRVRANTKHLDQGEMLQRQLGRVQLIGGHDQPLDHAAITVDAQHLQPFAAVGTPAATGDTFPTIQVWLNCTAVAHRQPETFSLRPKFDNLYAKLMAQDARIAEEGLSAAEGVQVGATNSNPTHAHQHFARPRRKGFGSLRHPKVTWLIQDNA
jgi:hypothetical protein